MGENTEGTKEWDKVLISYDLAAKCYRIQNSDGHGGFRKSDKGYDLKRVAQILLYSPKDCMVSKKIIIEIMDYVDKENEDRSKRLEKYRNGRKEGQLASMIEQK